MDYFQLARAVSLTDVVAIALSVVALIVATRANTKANKLQAEGLQIEKTRESDRLREFQRALLVAVMDRTSHSATLRIENRGQAAARNVMVSINHLDVENFEMIRDNDRPVGVIGPGATSSYGLITYDGMPDSYLVELRWRDDSSTEGRWESQLTLD